jgi:hypothetical protein
MAEQSYDEVIDLPFPRISPKAETEEILHLARLYVKKCVAILKQSNKKTNAVHIMGELTFTFHLVRLLKDKGVTCIASTTKRNVIENGNIKTTLFDFVRFREY